MDKITSFTIDHLNLQSGLYVSRRDRKGDCTVTTFDLRIIVPNREPVIDMPALHTIEHLGATFLRNCEIKEDVVYFGPMGCRTGFYLLTRDLAPETVLEALKEALAATISHTGEVFGATRKECGNYKELDIHAAKRECAAYLEVLNTHKGDFSYEQ